MARRLERGRLIAFKLVTATFFLSMVVTNDVALIVIVPVTMALGVTRKDLIVILEALAANAGSALTPIGNPQNLFIYWHYDLTPAVFMKTIWPFSLMFLVLLSICALTLETLPLHRDSHSAEPHEPNTRTWAYVAGLSIVVLAVVRVVPTAAGLAVILYALAADRPALRVDYGLLLTFIFFFGISDNLSNMLSAQFTSASSGHVLMSTALASQLVSNVPATLIISEFTSDWKTLLWGASTGGFGTLVAFLANLIAYRLYVMSEQDVRSGPFLAKFTAAGVAALMTATALQRAVQETGSHGTALT